MTAGELSDTIQIADFDTNRKQYWFNDGSYLGIVDEECLHHWTIQDAKDGDVLAEDSCIFIIQKLGNNNTAAKTYCTLYNDGDFDDGTILYFDIDSTKPATKEQRDLLFSKIKKSGYEWDAEKKELKEIHVIDEGKSEMDYCFTKMMNGEKVTPAWSIMALMEIPKVRCNLHKFPEAGGFVYRFESPVLCDTKAFSNPFDAILHKLPELLEEHKKMDAVNEIIKFNKGVLDAPDFK